MNMWHLTANCFWGLSDMRDLKFRGRRFDGTWVYGYYVQRGQEAFIFDEHGNEHLVKRETVGQYTGLKDKNGVEIYEDDILQTFNDVTGKKMANRLVVEYEELENCGCCTYDSGIGFNFNLNSPSTCEVIGNIYENPELLEKES